MLGDVQKGMDLELQEPVTGDRFFAQVKSSAGQAELDEFANSYITETNHRMYFIVHTTQGELKSDRPNLEILDAARLAEMVVDLGLTGWLLEKTY